MGRNKKKPEPVKKTTFWDFLIAAGSGFVNLLKIEKIVCLIALYIIGRDAYFVSKMEKDEIYSERIMDTQMIIELLQKDSTTSILIVAIICLVFVILFMIVTIRFVYVKEINRLSEVRSRLMHDVELENFHSLKEHRSSNTITS